jgi:type VI secretion system secreted protein Hcp
MAETVHLVLKANGTQIQGESTQTSLGRENTIECLAWEQAIETAREGGTAMATGRRQFKPVIIKKRIDKATPLLAKALTENAALEAQFMFFRPNPAGDGTTEQFFTVELKEARIASIKLWVPDATMPAAEAIPPLEQVELVFGNIVWTYNPSGVQHEDSWRASR